MLNPEDSISGQVKAFQHDGAAGVGWREVSRCQTTMHSPLKASNSK